MALAISVLALAFAAAPAAGDAAIEAAAEAAVLRQFTARAPQRDPALDQAARALARLALEQSAREAADPEAVAAELSRAGGWDPPPRALAVRGSPPERAGEMLASHRDLANLPATHFGVGTRSDGDLGAAVLLFTVRRAQLEPFPRAAQPNSRSELCGRLAFPLHDAQVVVSGPEGLSRPPMSPSDRRDRFCAQVRFGRTGTYTIEVEAQSATGPEVAALFYVAVGTPAPAPRHGGEGPSPETADTRKAEAQVLAAINGRRRADGLPPLARSALLDSVAADHSREMAAMGYFAHVSPVSGDVGERLRRAGFAFRRVAENLGEAESALAAERIIERSPAHLLNVLDSRVTLVGIGTAKVQRGSLRNVLLTVIFASPQSPEKGAGGAPRGGRALRRLPSRLEARPSRATTLGAGEEGPRLPRPGGDWRARAPFRRRQHPVGAERTRSAPSKERKPAEGRASSRFEAASAGCLARLEPRIARESVARTATRRERALSRARHDSGLFPPLFADGKGGSRVA